MIILQKSTDPQEIKIIPRASGGDTIVLTDEQTNTATTISTSFTDEKYYSKTSEVFDLEDNHFYLLEVKKSGEVIYKDRVFCTNQTVLNYSINHDRYTANVTDNEYIVI